MDLTKLQGIVDQYNVTEDPQSFYPESPLDRTPIPTLGESFGASTVNSSEYGLITGYVQDKLLQFDISGRFPGLYTKQAQERMQIYSGYSDVVQQAYGVKTREEYRQHKFKKDDITGFFGLPEQYLPSWFDGELSGAQIDTILSRENTRARNAKIADDAWRQDFWSKVSVGSGQLVGGAAVDTLAITAVTAGLGAGASAVSATKAAQLAAGTRIGQGIMGSRAVVGAGRVYTQLYGPKAGLVRNVQVAALENGLTELATLPIQIESNQNRNLTFTESDQAAQVITAGILGGALGGTLKTVMDGVQLRKMDSLLQNSKALQNVAAQAHMEKLKGNDVDIDGVLDQLVEKAPDMEAVEKAFNTSVELRTAEDIEVINKFKAYLARDVDEVLSAPEGTRHTAIAEKFMEGLESAKALTEAPEPRTPVIKRPKSRGRKRRTMQRNRVAGRSDLTDNPVSLPDPDLQAPEGVLPTLKDIDLSSDTDLALYRLADEESLTPGQQATLRDILESDGNLTEVELKELAVGIKQEVDAAISRGETSLGPVAPRVAEEIFPAPQNALSIFPEPVVRSAFIDLDNRTRMLQGILPEGDLKARLQNVLDEPDPVKKVDLLKKLEEDDLLPTTDRLRKLSTADQEATASALAEAKAALSKADANRKKVGTMNAKRTEKGEAPFSTAKTDAAYQQALTKFEEAELEYHNNRPFQNLSEEALSEAQVLEDLKNKAGLLVGENGLTDDVALKSVFRDVFKAINSLKKVSRAGDLREPLPEDPNSATWGPLIEQLRQEQPDMTNGQFIQEQATQMYGFLDQLENGPYLQDPTVRDILTRYSDDARIMLDEVQQKTDALESAVPEALNCLLESGTGVAL